MELHSLNLAPRVPANSTAQAIGGGSVRHSITSWMELHLGRAAMPVAALAGGAVGGTLGMLALGPVGGLAGGAAGAFYGALFFFAG